MTATTTAPSDSPVCLLTVPQVASRLNLGIRTVYRLIDEGKIPPGVKLGRCRRISAATLDAFIANGCRLDPSTS